MRKQGGELVLRIEDTDRERSTPQNVQLILDTLEWLGLDWDEGPVSQASRAGWHHARVEELLAAGRAYRDSATAEEVREWRERHGNRGYRGTPTDAPEAAVRLRVPDEGETVVSDVLRGDISFENRLQDDPVIARSDGSVLYNLAVAVDDVEMGITHVVRGDDHLSNTPKQLLVLEALEAEPPIYAHLPLLHGPDGKKLSKRHGAASAQDLQAAGYLPEAIRNYLALLGWGAEDDETIISTPELIERFELERVKTSSAIFDERKLRWMNGRYMRELAVSAYVERVARHLGLEADERLRKGCAIAQEKAQTLAEVWPLIRFLFEEPLDDEKAWRKTMKEGTAELLEAAREAIAGVEPFEVGSIEAALGEIVERNGVKPGQLYQPIRVAITGTTVSPGIFESVWALGRERSLQRIDAARSRLS